MDFGEHIFGILASWKCGCFGVVKLSLKMHLFTVSKCDAWQFVRLKTQGYMTYAESLFGILAVWNAILDGSCDSRLRSTCRPIGYLYAFWRTENAIPAGSWDPMFKGKLLVVQSFLAFWRPENNIPSWSWDTPLKIQDKEVLFSILAVWKCDSSFFIRFSAQGYLDYIERLLGILVS
jgi:hypothetical protein